MTYICAHNYDLDDIYIDADEKTDETPIIYQGGNNESYQREIDEKQIEDSSFDMIKTITQCKYIFDDFLEGKLEESSVETSAEYKS